VLIDGAHGEGGGQVVRTAVALSALTGAPLEVVNVRAGRGNPGLQAQHLTAVLAAAGLCGAEVRGAARGSVRFLFTPAGPVRAGEYGFDIGTAGAATLVAQTVLLPLAGAGGASRVTLTGGTHVPHAPPAEYLEAAYLPLLRRAGVEATWRSPAAGFYPRGGGRCELAIQGPPRPAALDLTERGRLLSLRAFVITANLAEHVAARGAATVERCLKAIGRRVTVERRDLPSPGPGAAVVLAAECEGGAAAFTGLGERGRPMEAVAEAPCAEFLAWWESGAACDEHLADQLVLPLALAGGESAWTTPRVTEHLRTVLWVAGHFLDLEWSLDEPAGGPARVCLRRAGDSGGLVG